MTPETSEQNEARSLFLSGCMPREAMGGRSFLMAVFRDDTRFSGSFYTPRAKSKI
jgi:hypothetical protein